MKAYLLSTARAIWSSYWLLPGGLSIGGAVLSILTLYLDGIVGARWLPGWDWLKASDPEGARAVLATIGGSMISVAGVVFSITIAAVVFASAQYGAHLIPAFIRDRANQATLGVFLSTFVFCMVALRSIYSGEAAFVPHLTTAMSLVLAGASIVMLIFFIHHILHSVHVSSIVARLGRSLIGAIEQRFPAEMGEGASSGPNAALPPGMAQDTVAILADGNGYIHTLSEDALFSAACNHNLVVQLERQPGDFVAPGRCLARIWPPENASADARDEIRRTFVWGAERTADQDVGFLIDQLGGIASRSLSPGVNDPYTALDTINWLGAALTQAGRGDAPAAIRLDASGKPRVIARPLSFEDLTQMIVGRLQPYAVDDPIAVRGLRAMLSDVAETLHDPDKASAIARCLERLDAAMEAKHRTPSDAEPS